MFFWDTRGKTKDSESSFVASAQYLEHSSSHHEQQHDDVAAVAGGGVGGGGGQDHHHQSYQPQHHHCVSLRVTHWYCPFKKKISFDRNLSSCYSRKQRGKVLKVS